MQLLPQIKVTTYNTDNVRRVASDFHELPFPDSAFEVVYIASALHHTEHWESVLDEMIRVTASGGIMILQNEPLNRNFCFYKFRTNRPNQFLPIEEELKHLGILSTVAEPYPGSRPETLFGMIENQKMQLGDVLAKLSSAGEITHLSVDSDICISD